MVDEEDQDDIDFVVKPIRTYKRRKRSAPLYTESAEMILEKENIKDIKKFKFSGAITDQVHVHDSSSSSSKYPADASLSPDDDSLRISINLNSTIPAASTLTELESFLSTKTNLLGSSIFDGPALPDLEIETVPREQDTELTDPTPAVEPHLTRGQALRDGKLAAQTLCDNVNKRTQATLEGVITTRPDCRTAGTVKSAGLVGGVSEALEDKDSVRSDPAAVPSNKRIVRQPGTKQLDLGAMFGMKPKVPTPEPATSSKPVKKEAPFYKWIKGTSFTVDAFNFGEIPKCTAYFLSHFHADHYMGLNKHFKGTLYCSKVTANYVIHNLKVNPSQVNPLEMDTTHEIQGVSVSLIDANHCPGSVMFVFHGPNRSSPILHTGDFRYHQAMLCHPLLAEETFEAIYLDTTYFNPAYRFPSQDSVIQFMANEVNKFTKDTLIVCGSYTIGKERLVEGIAKALGCQIRVNQSRMSLIKHQDNDHLAKRLTKSKTAPLQLVPMKEVNKKDLAVLLSTTPGFSSIVGIRPTGWTHRASQPLQEIKPSGGGKVWIYEVPYSEHSSYDELEEFLRAVKVKRVIPTVMPSNQADKIVMFEKIKEWTNPCE